MRTQRIMPAVVMLALTATTFAAPGLMNYSGRLLDQTADPVTTPVTASFSFYDSATTGMLLGGYTYTTTVTPNTDGLYSVEIGNPASGTGGSVPSIIFEQTAVWLNVTIGGESLAPRARLATVAYAFSADQATTAAVATTATTALLAATALSAQTAATADYADDAAHASHADSASAADVSTSATFALTAAHADTSTQASHATTAHNATTATTALQALGLSGTAFITAASTGTALENGQGLLKAYARAKMLTPNGQPRSATNRAVLLVPPGRYDLSTGSLNLDTEFVDLVGLSSARDNQWIFGRSAGAGTGVLMQAANDVRLENLTVECTLSTGMFAFGPTHPAAYFPTATTSAATRVRNCTFRANDINALPARPSVNYMGKYMDCHGGRALFCGTASGTFVDCTGGNDAFGGAGGSASGNFINCTGGAAAFGGTSVGVSGTASGTFTDCTGGTFAFGGDGTASGKFVRCTGLDWAFGLVATGTFEQCRGGNHAFGTDIARGTFTDCTAGDLSFGGYNEASGTFTRCTAGIYSFGAPAGKTTGFFSHCKAGRLSFVGSGLNLAVLEYCEAGYGSFPPGAKTILYCIREGAAYP